LLPFGRNDNSHLRSTMYLIAARSAVLARIW